MNTIITSIADTLPASQPRPKGRSHADPAMVTVVGCGAGALLALSAALTATAHPEAGNLALGGNAALVLFAALSMDRPYRRFWAPALFALAGVGLTGLVIALIPSMNLSAMQVAMGQFGLEGVHIVFQLAAMALVAMGWSTAGRSPARMRASGICVGILATMQMLQALHGAVDLRAALLWTQTIDLVFAIWLIRTAFCLLRPRFRA